MAPVFRKDHAQTIQCDGLQPPQRDKNPRQPPACAFGVPICSTNSSFGASSSTPGSSGGRRIGITAGALLALARSMRERNKGAGAAACGSGSGCGGDAWGAGCGGAAGGAAGKRTGSAVATCGELSCAAGSGFTSAGSSRGGSAGTSVTATSRRGEGAASMASSNGEDSIVAPLSDGRLATGVCHWKASSLPVTGDTGRQRSLT